LPRSLFDFIGAYPLVEFEGLVERGAITKRNLDGHQIRDIRLVKLFPHAPFGA
jgi:hypothetical protein